MLLLDGFPEGSDITVLNVYYQQYDYQTKKEDYATIVFKDNVTKQKHVRVIKSPKYTYYIAKPEIQVEHNMQFIDKNLVDPVVCNYRDILFSIAQNTGNLDLYMDNIKSGNAKVNRMFYMHPRVFGADMDILNYIRMEFADTYKNTPCPVSIAFFDIETDISFTQLQSWAVRKTSPILLDSLNSWFRRIREEGTFEAIYRKYYTESDN